MPAKEVVQQFCSGMRNRDAEALRPYLADDVVYQNAGMEPQPMDTWNSSLAVSADRGVSRSHDRARVRA